MGNVISRSASAADILRDLNLAFLAANHKGAPFADDATRYLKASVDLAVTLAARRATNQATVDGLRARQQILDVKCNDLVGKHRDTLWNGIGRPANDPIFNQMFPAGVGGYTKTPASRKHISLQLLAGLLENTTHPLIAKELATSIVTELRTEAEALKAVNGELLSARSEANLLQIQFTASARQGQIQMARVKKYWRSMGVSEADIHAILPDRPIGTAPAAAVEGAATAPVTAAPAAPSGPTLSVVPPLVDEELPPEPEGTDEEEEAPAAPADPTLSMDEEVVAAK